MKLPHLLHWFDRHIQKIPLRSMLVVPFVLQIAGAVGLVGYLSFLHGQRAVNDLVTQLMVEVGDRIEQNLLNYLRTPAEITRNNAATIRLGILDWRNIPTLKRYLWQQLQIFDGISAVVIANQQKDFIGVEKRNDGSISIRIRDQSTNYQLKNYLANSRGEYVKLLKSNPRFDPYNDPPGDPWYQRAKSAGHSTWRLVVSLVDFDNPVLMAVNFQPFYDRNNTFRGVLASSVYLSQLGNFLESLKIGKTGQAFIVDRSGFLIATSTGELPFLRHTADLDQPKHPENLDRNLHPQKRRLSAVKSHDFLTHHASQYLIEQFSGFNRIKDRQQLSFEIDRRRYFVQVVPLQSNQNLDWLTVVVVPESEFMAQIQTSTSITILLCGATLLVSIGIGVFTTRWLTQPILRLNASAKKIAQGGFDFSVLVERTDELGELASSFNRMAAQLKTSFAKMQTLNQALSESKDRDIKQRKAAEQVLADYNRILEAQVAERTEALRQSEAINWAIRDALPDLLIRMRRDGTYLDIKPPADFPLIKPISVMQGANVRDILPPEAVGQRLQSVERALQTGETQIYKFPLLIEQQTQWQEVRIVALGADEVLIVIREITNRKQFEEALRQSEERFRSAFDSAPIGMALIGLDDRWLKVNPVLCDMLGYSEPELLSMDASALVHPEDIDQLQGCVEQMRSNKNCSVPVELRYCSNRGRIVWGLMSLSLVRDDQSQPLYYVAQIQDITERQAVDRIKSEFISIVSHELRTPLTAILGSLGLLATGIYDNKPEKAKRMIEIALIDSERLVRLVNDILDLERLDSGKVQLVMEVCEVNNLMQRAVEAMQAIADELSVTLCVVPIWVQVWAAPDSILQTLTNLLSNAIKFSPPNSIVILSAQPQSDSVVFQVKDRGRGIPADKLEIIFGRFQQVDISDSRQKGGTGLGLAICQSIVQQHGGQIWVESTVGKGSAFYFTLPTPS